MGRRLRVDGREAGPTVVLGLRCRRAARAARAEGKGRAPEDAGSGKRTTGRCPTAGSPTAGSPTAGHANGGRWPRSRRTAEISTASIGRAHGSLMGMTAGQMFHVKHAQLPHPCGTPAADRWRLAGRSLLMNYDPDLDRRTVNSDHGPIRLTLGLTEEPPCFQDRPSATNQSAQRVPSVRNRRPSTLGVHPPHAGEPADPNRIEAGRLSHYFDSEAIEFAWCQPLCTEDPRHRGWIHSRLWMADRGSG